MNVYVFSDIAHLSTAHDFERRARTLISAGDAEVNFKYVPLAARLTSENEMEYFLVVVEQWDEEADDAFYRNITRAREWGFRTTWDGEALYHVRIERDENEVPPALIVEIVGSSRIGVADMVDAYLSAFNPEINAIYFTPAMVEAFLSGVLPANTDWSAVESDHFSIRSGAHNSRREIRIAFTSSDRRRIFAELICTSVLDGGASREFAFTIASYDRDVRVFDGEASARLWSAALRNLTEGWFVRFHDGRSATYKLGEGIVYHAA